MKYDIMEIRRRLADPDDVAKRLGISPSRKERKKWICPRHGGSSLSLAVGRDGTLWAHCFGCDFAGDVLSLINETLGLTSTRAVIELAAELAGVSASATPLPPHRLLPATPEPTYPPVDEVHALFDACVVRSAHGELASLYLDPELEIYLRGRAIDPERAWRCGLIYHLPKNAQVPSWARCGVPWPRSGHRLLVPLFDAHGEMRSVRAWRPGSESPKRVAPKSYTTRGLVCADLWGQALLRGEGTNPKVVIVEGEPDFLTLASRGRLLDVRPAIFAVSSGSWTHDLAARIADGSTVIIATDPDSAGDRYAEEIARTLVPRCRVMRKRLTTDLNDAAMEAAAQ